MRARFLVVILPAAAAALALACGTILEIDDTPSPPNGEGGAKADALDPGGDGGVVLIDGAPVDECTGLDLARDRDNCGLCRKKCPDVETCVAGKCQQKIACDAGTTACGSGTDTQICVNVDDDENNCGACGRACNFPSCVAGECDHLVFATDTKYDANAFGGVAGADATCQSLATAAGKKWKFKAWISDDSSSPSTRFGPPGDRPYRLVDGVTVIANAKALVGGANLLHAIDRTENGGDAKTSPIEAWTNTKTDGTAAGSKPCGNWTMPSNTTVGVGLTTSKLSSWTNALGSCNNKGRLYCFEQ